MQENKIYKERFPNLVKRVKLFKEKKEGINIMCDIIDRERAEGKTEGKAEGKAEVIALIRRKYQKQNTPEQAAEALELEIDYVRKVMNMIAADEGQSMKPLPCSFSGKKCSMQQRKIMKLFKNIFQNES